MVCYIKYMSNITANSTETLAFLVTIVMFFIPPLVLLVFFRIVSPKMEYIRCVSFYVGWIPMNLISCGYFGYSTGSFMNFFAILVGCQIMQLFFVIFMRHIFFEIFGEQAFREPL
jgi:hypothetical protein